MNDDLIKVLAQARENKFILKEEMKAMLDAVTESPKYKELEGKLAAAVEKEVAAIGAVQDAAFAEFEASQMENKHPHPTVSIKEYTDVEIVDENKAREWCFSNFRPALTVDFKVLSSAAKQGNIPDELFVMHSHYKATIKTDLSEYLDVT